MVCMVWYGVYGMVWCVWYGMVCMVWYGVYGMVWCVVWYGVYGMVWCVWYGMVYVVWHGVSSMGSHTLAHIIVMLAHTTLLCAFIVFSCF